MLKLLSTIVRILLIGIIFLRIPRESVGLASFGTTLGLPSSAERFVNILIAFGTLIYFGIAIKENL